MSIIMNISQRASEEEFYEKVFERNLRRNDNSGYVSCSISDVGSSRWNKADTI